MWYLMSRQEALQDTLDKSFMTSQNKEKYDQKKVT